VRPLRCGSARAITSCGFCGFYGFRGASSRSSGSRNREPMHDARLRVQCGSSFSFQRVFLGKRRHAPSTIIHALAEARFTSRLSSKHQPCKHPPHLRSGAIWTLEPCSASRDLPLGEVSPVASLLSPKRDHTFHSAVSCSSSFLGLNLQSFHLPSPNANASRELSHGCSRLFKAVHRLCPLFLLLWPKH
jgi:hypothetical protein